MSTVNEGLILVIRSLPEADKEVVISRLWEEDPVSKKVLVELVVKSLLQVRGHGEKVITTKQSHDVTKVLSSKERGKRMREKYVSELQKKGIRIQQVDSVWAKTIAGLWVGIPVATERRTNRWFLGLSENDVLVKIRQGGLVVVLLCQSEPGATLDFVIATNMIQEVVGSLSKSKSQLKFNLKKVGDRYYLVLPGRDSVDVSQFLGRLSPLES